MERKRLLLLAATTGYQTRVFADAAERMGVEFVLATDRCHILEDPWGDHAIAVRFNKRDRSAALLADEARRRPFDGIVAVGDRPTPLAAAAAARLGIPYNPPEAVHACRSKFRAREGFRAAGLLVPRYFTVPVTEDAAGAAERAPYPCVLKPLSLSGSRGVIRADKQHEFVAAFARIAAILQRGDVRRAREDRDDYIQVESFIPGKEFALEGLVTGGVLQTLAIFDKPDPLNGPFFEETIYVTPSREGSALQRQIMDVTQQAVRALGLVRGPVHAEMRVNGEGVWMLEVAARPIGGLCARALRFGCGGISLEELVIRHALGEDVSGFQREDQASGVMMIPVPRDGIYSGVRGVDEAKQVPCVEDVMITAKEGYELLRLPEGSTYLGFIFARAASPQEVESALRQAHHRLRFEIFATLPVR